MREETALVITTINKPTTAMIEFARGAKNIGIKFIVIGDASSPKDFTLPGATYFDLKKQRESKFKYAKKCPERHYARKNIGYLIAADLGAQIIIESDDDNIPRDAFFQNRQRFERLGEVTKKGWCNVYKHFSSLNIWPRGLPLGEIHAEPTMDLPFSTLDCPIQQGLADGDPDVDAIYRLVLPLPVEFSAKTGVSLAENVWCPFNSQNTTWWKDAFPLMYLPFHCSFRMTDIWRSFVAQRIAWENAWRVSFHSPTVFQDRNEHDLMKDFIEEVPGYLNNVRIRSTLENLNLEKGADEVCNNLLKCYAALVSIGVIDSKEIELLNLWINDIRALPK